MRARFRPHLFDFPIAAKLPEGKLNLRRQEKQLSNKTLGVDSVADKATKTLLSKTKGRGPAEGTDQHPGGKMLPHWSPCHKSNTEKKLPSFAFMLLPTTFYVTGTTFSLLIISAPFMANRQTAVEYRKISNGRTGLYQAACQMFKETLMVGAGWEQFNYPAANCEVVNA